MQGMMMQRPLLVSEILKYGQDAYPEAEIVSARSGGTIHRQTFTETARRTARLAHALVQHGIAPGDRVATLAMNSHRHLELYYGISGVGAVCHTINPRLAAEQMVYIITHAGDRMLFLDPAFVPLVAAIRDQLPKDLVFAILSDREGMPETPFPALCYETLLEGHPETFDWREVDENAACGLCYTSGTTGAPKGVLYSHRSSVLHAMSAAIMLKRSFGENQRLLPVVPLFHVNAWGLPFSALMTGTSLVMPGAALDGPSLFRLLEQERVFSSWGVPTVWTGLLEEIRARGRKPEMLGELVIGGSAVPRAMIEAFERMGVSINHAWGMTETSPIGTHGGPPAWLEDEPFARQVDYKATQGRRVYGVDLRLVDENDHPLPKDGKTVGELQVRGNAIAAGYFRNEEASAAALTPDGWFRTGDVATIDTEGFLRLCDRTKDLIKSGGEWISSIDLENATLSLPGIATCAAVAVPHPRWDERPVLVAVAAEGERPTLDRIHRHLEGHFARWQLPDDVIWVDSLPMTATGKVSKRKLRESLKDYRHPDLRETAREQDPVGGG